MIRMKGYNKNSNIFPSTWFSLNTIKYIFEVPEVGSCEYEVGTAHARKFHKKKVLQKGISIRKKPEVNTYSKIMYRKQQ